MTGRRNVKMQTRLQFRPIASTVRDVGRNINDVPHQIAASTAVVEVKAPTSQLPQTPKNFGDLPGGQKPPVLIMKEAYTDMRVEIRNIIYQLLCEDIMFNARQGRSKGSLSTYEILFLDPADPYANSRPLAWLGVSRQVQAEFFQLLPLSNPEVNCAIPFGTFDLVSRVPSSLDPGFSYDPQVVVEYIYEETDNIEILVALWIPGCMDLTDQCYESLKGTVHRLFNTKEKFTTLWSMVAADQLFTTFLDLEVCESIMGESERMIQFWVKLQHSDDGTWRILRDESREPAGPWR